MNQKLSKQELISCFRLKPLEQLPKHFQNLTQQFPQLFKSFSCQPTQTRMLKGFNQELLVYSSNQSTPLKTAGIQMQDQFKFDEKVFTPQPQIQTTTFDFSQPAIQKRHPVFSYTRAGRLNSLNAPIWYYVDDFQKVEGPFSTIQMDSWYSRGLLEDILRVGFDQQDTEHWGRLYTLKSHKLNKLDCKLMRTLLRRKSCEILFKESIGGKELQVKNVDEKVDENMTVVLKLPITKKKKN